jgi:lysozyme family protein
MIGAENTDVFEEAWRRTGLAEKGYVFDPRDPGGETNLGITVRVARLHGYTGKMRDLPKETARAIARSEYWNPLRLQQIAEISALVAMEVFDTNFNLYSGAAATFLQRSLTALNRETKDYPDIRVDGLIGAGTIEALRAFMNKRGKDGELVLLRCLNSLQCAEYIRQAEARPIAEAFLFGWVLTRVNEGT